MIPKKNLLSLMLPLLIATPTILSANVSNNKQLAGPPSEFDFMLPAQAEKSAFASKTALIPVTLAETKEGNWYWNSKIAVDSRDFSFILLANGSKNWQIELRNPITKQIMRADDVALKHVSTNYGLEGNKHLGEKYTFANMDTGNWDISVKT
ncbi:MAG TPA: hypothetical protein ENJ41_05095, partial [Oceanospirillales bacterium]|nr:hypothetical protein [Oceanospirillales bacterium]